ncbi:Trypsin-co-occurring domain-containing protein [Tumidithrix helvetica PCC 7403]|uniref:CU044_2847 family protein n=1 Tax=Tumidithrix helvetica TaxID=3457545 RepID=UPI003CB03B6E
MSEMQELVVKGENGEEFSIYIAPKETYNEPDSEEGYRDNLPTVDLKKVHDTIRGYTTYAIGAFRNLGAAEVDKITLKFSLKIGGKAGIPMLTEGSAESNFEIQVECKFPSKP